MSRSRSKQTRTSLDRLVDEAKRDAPREVAWDAIEEKVFRRVPSVMPPARPTTSRAVWLFCAVGVLAGAAGAVLALRSPDPKPAPSAQTERGAGELREDGNGLRVAGRVVTRGHVPRVGEAVETTATSASFSLQDRVTWILEPLGRAFVQSSGDVLVLALDAGAVEAEVVPSAKPETFAVDLGYSGQTVRISVHGTHFRVERAGVDVVLDLSEGVVGIASREANAKTEHRVTAPAHVTFSLARFEESFHVDDRKDRVRIPSNAIPVRQDNPIAIQHPTHPTVAPKPSAEAVVRPASSALPEVAPARSPATPAPATASLEETIRRGVTACFEKEGPPPGSVTTTIATTLLLELDSRGVVTAARFSPPLPPSMQTCAAESLYAQSFPGRGGKIDLPLTLSR